MAMRLYITFEYVQVIKRRVATGDCSAYTSVLRTLICSVHTQRAKKISATSRHCAAYSVSK